MEPLAALSVAANVIQVVDFGTRALNAGRQLHKDGSTVENDELEGATREFIEINDTLKSHVSTGNLSKHDQLLGKLADECTNIADDIISLLEKLKTKEPAPKWKSTIQVLPVMWNKNKIDAMKKRLGEMRRELEFGVLASIRKRVDLDSIRQEEGFRALSTETKQLIETVLGGIEGVKANLEESTATVLGRHDRSDQLANQRHGETLAAISSLSVSSRRLRAQDRVECHTMRETRAVQCNRVLQWLNFRMRTDRHEVIEPAHRETYEWIFRDTRSQKKPWSDLVEWLETGSGIYWINGKAGSGKSTLMKLINGHQCTVKALNKWAAEVPLATPSFYFWNTGTELQNSHAGLLRSMLYEVLSVHKSLIPAVFPDILDMLSHKNPDLGPPSNAELKKAFKALVTQDKVTLRLFFLIDGLDEFSGEMAEIADFLQTATDSPNIKALVSSRPLPVFEVRFGRFPGLKLQDLTFDDIQTYVRDTLNNHERMVELARYDDLGAFKFSSEVVHMSSGVFLWARLVVRSLVEGLENFDRIPDLKERLCELPADVEDLYWHMLRKIPRRYLREASLIFRIVRARIVEPLTLRDLLFALEQEPGFTWDAPLHDITLEELTTKTGILGARLASRCGGLLEIRESKRSSSVTDEIDFIHKSAADFLDRPDVWDEVFSGSGDGTSQFDENVASSRAWLVRTKLMAPQNKCSLILARGWGWDAEVATFYQTTIDECLTACRRAEMSTGQARTDIVEALVPVIASFPPRYTSETLLTELIDEDCLMLSPLTVAVRYSLVLSVQEKLQTFGKSVLPISAGRLLYYALYKWTDGRNVEIVEMLLGHGADPNEEVNGISPWQRLLMTLQIFVKYPFPSALKLTKLLVLQGADTQASPVEEQAGFGWKPCQLPGCWPLTILREFYFDEKKRVKGVSKKDFKDLLDIMLNRGWEPCESHRSEIYKTFYEDSHE